MAGLVSLNISFIWMYLFRCNLLRIYTSMLGHGKSIVKVFVFFVLIEKYRNVCSTAEKTLSLH